MEDKAIKDFDRSIESMMNESSVAPPFGAWNRIAGELDAVPAATTAIPGRSPLFNTGTIVGFVSGALMIGTMVTGWLVYNNYNATEQTGKTLAVTENAQKNEMVNTAITPVTETKIETPTVEAKTVSIVTATTKKKDSSAENVIAKAIVPEVAAPTVKLPVDKEKQTGEAYYFPPVDIDMPEKNDIKANNAVSIKEEPKTEPAKIEVKKTSSSGDRVKFKKRKPAKWNYGRLNRTKSKSKY